MKRKAKTCEIIYLCGLRPCSGTTHTTILLANYLRAKRLKVAVYDMSGKQSLNEIEMVYEGLGHMPKEAVFKIKQVTYYTDRSIENLMEAGIQGYDYILVDGGVYGQEGSLVRIANRVILVTMTALWHQVKTLQTLSTMQGSWRKKTVLVMPLTEDEEVAFYRKHCQLPTFSMAMAPDPFVHSKEVDLIWDRLMEV